MKKLSNTIKYYLAVSFIMFCSFLILFSPKVSRADFQNTPDINIDDPYGVTSDVNTVAVASDGSFYIGGEFTGVGLTDINYIAHIGADGAILADTFNTSMSGVSGGANGIVHELKLSEDESTLYVGGAFTKMNGQDRNYIASLDTTDGSVTTFDPGITVGLAVYSIDLSADESIVYFGGSFQTISGELHPSIAAAYAEDSKDHSQGDLVTSFTDTAAVLGVAVYSIKLSPDDSILYIAGNFVLINGDTIYGFGGINTSDGSRNSFNPGLANTDIGYDIDISSDGGTLYAVGAFTTACSGTTRNNFAAFDTSETCELTSLDPNLDAEGHSVTLSPDESVLAIGGYFTLVNGGGTIKEGIAVLDPDTGIFQDFDPSLNMGNPFFGALDVEFNSASSRIFVGGDYQMVDLVMGTAAINTFVSIGVSISESSLSLTEGGSDGTYTVVLNTLPTDTVTVNFDDSSDQVSAVATATLESYLEFTIGNWGTPQEITVSSLDDDIAEGSHSDTIHTPLQVLI